MAKEAATLDVDEHDESSLWPELDNSNPQHKKLLSAAKRFAKMKKERDELLKESKEKFDEQNDEVVALMHEAHITKFKHGAATWEIKPGKEKCVIKIDPEVDEDESSE